MIVVDVNVLVAALHTGAAEHELTRVWSEAAVRDPEPLAVTDAVLTGTLRVVTHPRVFDPPVAPERARAVIDQLINHPGVIIVHPLVGFWPRLRHLVGETKARGTLVADAAHAVVAMQHGGVWISRDGDFARFGGVKWRRPDV